MSAPARLTRAAIVAVGSELLTPDKVDTNSLFLTERLNALGVSVCYKVVVGDDEDDISTAVRDCISRAELVVVTGGLGATDDDVTRDAVAAVFGLTLCEDPNLVSSIRSRFESRGLKMPNINRRQARVPEGAIVITNPCGTAPGLWMERENGACLLLPGPLRELRPMFERVVGERIAGRTAGQRIFRRVLRIVGWTESHVEALTYPIYSRWREPRPVVTTTVLASLGQIELHLSMRADDDQRATKVLDGATAELTNVLGEHLVSSDGAQLEAVVGRLLIDYECRVAVAESCTGGLTMSRLTDVPGSSAYVRAGWIVYSNQAKIELLGVDERVIAAYGAVSEEVASAMAEQACRRARVDYGLGITGIAGPSGGSEQKPVGSVCIGLAGIGGLICVDTFRFPGDRDRVKFQASQTALDVLRKELQRRASAGHPTIAR